MESSGLGNLFDACTNHLTEAHSNFLRHWNWLIDLEAKEAEVGFMNVTPIYNLQPKRTKINKASAHFSARKEGNLAKCKEQ